MKQFKLMLVVLFSTLLLCSSQAWSLNRFIDLNDGTMLDTSSSLRWLKNANCFVIQNWDEAISSAAGLAAPTCGLSDGTVAGDWHLPTKDELSTLVAAPDNYRYNTLNAAGFTNVQAFNYWSSSSYAFSTISAWIVNVDSGYENVNYKDYNNYVWPVRSGQYWSLDSLIITGGADFGSVPAGSTSPGHQFTLKNSSASSLSVTSIALSGTDSDQFTLATGGTTPCSSLASLTLAGGASCTVLVSAKPTIFGSKSANLTVSSGGSSVNVPLTATGAALSVTYNGNGNSSGSLPVDSTAYVLNATVTVLNNSGGLAKSGYLFEGWNTAADGSGISYQPGTTFVITAPTTLYAKWVAPIAPPSGMVSWLRGENNAFDTVTGLTGQANGTTYGTGRVGQAFTLNGTANYLSVADSTAFHTNQFSASAWFKWDETGTANVGFILGKAYEHFEIHTGGIGVNNLRFIPAGHPATTVDAPNSITAGWNHVAVTYSGSEAKIYHNGQQVAVKSGITGGADLTADSTPLAIGRRGFQAEYFFKGMIDEVQLFNRVLNSSEIQALYNAGSAGIAPPPTITAISPSSGSATGGTPVTITGSGLISTSAVKFGAVAATGFTVNSDSQITAVAPAGSAGAVDITVTTPGGTSATSSADQYVYMLDQTISFGAAPLIRVGGNGVVSATASSGLVVSFSSQTPSTCSVSGTTVSGLAPGTCTIAADQAGDSTYSPAGQQTQSFEIGAAVAPTVSTTAATSITGSGATLNATVNANYSSAVVSFEYGTTTTYGSTANASPSPVSGGTSTPIFATISGLAPATTYHFRVKAVNATTGTVYGEDLTFTTAPPRFVDLNDGTMLDTVTSLRWLKNANCFGLQNWYAAISYASALAAPACGLTDGSAAGDWHLPTIEELRFFNDAGYRYNTLTTAGFSKVQAYFYWSSSAYADSPDYAWVVYMNYDNVYRIKKDFEGYVWPVRAGQYWQVGPLVVVGTGSFGALPAGSASSGHQITLKNAGIAELPVTSIALSGADSGQFSVVAGGSSPCDSLSPTLAAGASCTVLVTATPTSMGSKNADLTVTTAVGSTTVPLTATASYPVPTVTGISPSSGYATGGTLVTITGTALTGATAVKFGATDAASFSTGSDTQATATSPAGLIGQTVDITVTTPGGTSAVSSADQFSYTLQYQAKNQSTTTSYTTLAEAIANAAAGHEIRAYGGQFDGALSLVRDIILNGGYNMSFSAKESLPTTLNGGLTITGGVAKVDSVTLKGTLTIQGGSLQVSGVVVQ